MDLTDPITKLLGVGPIAATKLEKLGVKTIFDLLYHLPFRYEDRTRISKISQVRPGDTVTIIGQLKDIKNEFTRRGKVLQSGQVSDASGSIGLAWFNQSYLVKALGVGNYYLLHGKVQFFGRKLVIVAPDYEQVAPDTHQGKIMSVYPETAGLTSKWIRNKMRLLLDQISFSDFIEEVDLTGWKDSLEGVHFPSKIEDVTNYRKRLAFDELLLLQLASMVHKQNWKKTKLAHALSVDFIPVDKFLTSLPFSLTTSQRTSIHDIAKDLSQTKAMNRLLEGDVGSGKTVVAATAALIAYLNKFQTLVLAPTQILATQHFQTFTKLFQGLDTKIGLVTGNVKRFSADSDIIVGTHALLSQGIDFAKVGLVIIDEQHRFGVAQRGLAAAKGQTPHILTMTATPIPRTIALTLYGDLDLSVLSDMPLGRKIVKTWVVPESKRGSSFDWIARQLKEDGSQCFWVCPFIDESDSLTTVKAVLVEYEKIKKQFAQLNVGLLHGRMKAKEKDAVLEQFQRHEIDILVCTPVVEVGIDIPKANIMVIEAAERFGLAQLHQLRGRVGRSGQQAYCLLFSPNPTERLHSLEQNHSGLALAEIDMKLRGPGDIMGTAQHGLPGFKVATYDDIEAIQAAQALAIKLLPRLEKMPLLRSLVEKDKIGLVQPN